MSTRLERMADWSSQLGFHDLPARVVTKAKLQLLSVMAAVYAGYPGRAVRAIREVALSTRASGRATVFPQGDRTSPTVAVLANAAASMALEFDDYLFLGHTGHSAVLGSLALAEEEGLPGSDLLLSQVVANEVAGRLGASVLLGPQNGQLWTHLHAFGCACAGARLLKLSPAATANALGLALYQPPLATWPGFMGPDSKLLSASFPARDGLLAAKLAAWGLSGPIDALDDPDGFGKHFAYRFMPQLFSGFGSAWVTDTLSYKIHPGCAYVSAALDAFFDIASQFESAHHRRLEASDIQSIQVRTTLLGTEMERLGAAHHKDPLNAIQVNFSIPYSLALAALAGHLHPADLDEGELAQRAGPLRALAERVSVQHDWEMTIGLMDQFSSHLPLRALLGDLSTRDALGLRQEVGGHLSGALDLNPSELFRLASLVAGRAPRWLLGAGRAAAGRLTDWWTEKPGQPEPVVDLAQAELERLPMAFAAQVNLVTRGDLRFSARVDIPLGAAGRDPAETSGLVRRKFREQASRFLPDLQVEHALELVDHLETLENVADLAHTLCVP